MSVRSVGGQHLRGISNKTPHRECKKWWDGLKLLLKLTQNVIYIERTNGFFHAQADSNRRNRDKPETTLNPLQKIAFVQYPTTRLLENKITKPLGSRDLRVTATNSKRWRQSVLSVGDCLQEHYKQ